jgi:hypothetical protein
MYLYSLQIKGDSKQQPLLIQNRHRASFRDVALFYIIQNIGDWRMSKNNHDNLLNNRENYILSQYNTMLIISSTFIER